MKAENITFPKWHPHGACLISRQYKVMYISSPKCACTTIDRIFHKIKYGCERTSYWDVEDRDDYWKFTTTRHPAVRFVSAYIELTTGNWPQVKDQEWFGMEEGPEKLDVFIRAVEQGRLQDVHILPLSVLHEGIPIDLYLPIERLGNEIVLTKANLCMKTPHENRSKPEDTMRVHNNLPHWGRIQSLYKKDYILWLKSNTPYAMSGIAIREIYETIEEIERS